MTYQEFLDALRNTPRDWCLTSDGRIRRANTKRSAQCPISSLCGLGSGDFEEAAKRIGLDSELAWTFVCAADDPDRDAPTNLIRRDLLEACGLKDIA
jgi:hypothetical protein